MDVTATLLLFLTIPNPHPPEIVLEDALRFGLTKEQAVECRQFNQRCHTHAEFQMILSGHNSRYWEVVKQEIHARYLVWDCLADALPNEDGSNCWGEANRLSWLSQLRDRIGIHDFYTGRMPAPVPYWYFRELP